MQAVKTNVLNAEINLIVQAVKRDFIYKLISDGHYQKKKDNVNHALLNVLVVMPRVLRIVQNVQMATTQIIKCLIGGCQMLILKDMANAKNVTLPVFIVLMDHHVQIVSQDIIKSMLLLQEEFQTEMEMSV